ncbi:MAG: hypothetical protein LBD58_13615 [Treponema sp.]|jgi:hypothetical protein|nr:hypothetical protein [Treponema sp.]
MGRGFLKKAAAVSVPKRADAGLPAASAVRRCGGGLEGFPYGLESYDNSASGALASNIAGKSVAITIGGAASDFVNLESVHYVRKAFKDAGATSIDITTARPPVYDADKWLKLDYIGIQEVNLYKDYTAASTSRMSGVNVVRNSEFR